MISSIGISVAALAGVALVGCTSKVPEVHELTKPVYSWSWTRGGCGGRRALDGDGTLWLEEGCEDGRPKMTRGPRAPVAQRAAIVQAFARLPEPGTASCEPAHAFQIDAGGRVRTWNICEATDPRLSSGVYAEVLGAFRGSSP